MRTSQVQSHPMSYTWPEGFISAEKEKHTAVSLSQCESTEMIVIAGGSLFSLLTDIAVFFRESFLRINVWEKDSQDKRHKCLSPIGETCWWAKHDALKKVYGSFGHPEKGLYVDLLALSVIRDRASMKTTVRVRARSFIVALLRYETTITAQIYLRIFEQTSPLSKYLQTEGMDILTAHRMVVATQKNLQGMDRDFVPVKTAADRFVQWANDDTRGGQ
ncbi:hypothetical protein MHYP_G00200470 [Metynnis hypsauchen]